MLHTLNRFAPISLSEMDGAVLMDRQDTKFALPLTAVPGLLESLCHEDYLVLEVNGQRRSRYQSLYFDTPQYDFFRAHHNRSLNRLKVRYRLYQDSNLCFFEIKQKSNKSRTEKTRIQVEAPTMCLREPEMRFLAEKTAWDAAHLEPTLWVEYERTTLVRRDQAERLTLDTALCFWSAGRDRLYQLPGLAILELKQSRATRQSPVAEALRAAQIKPLSVSKYCLAAMSLGYPVKYNLFKTKLIRLSKIVTDDTLRRIAHAPALGGPSHAEHAGA